ncbi:Predicted dehydrogenase [bacterium A37T11]|nr:Predicted dehydrogenase [bacterium A37T11]
MVTRIKRREFIRAGLLTGAAVAVNNLPLSALINPEIRINTGKRVGIIGLDTSHSVAFTKALNAADANPDFAGYKVVVAYPFGSRTIESSASRIPDYTKEVQSCGVQIVSSLDELLLAADVVMLETNDGRLHVEQALKVLKARKPLFIDKPLAASFADVKKIFNASAAFQTPIFSSSALRYLAGLPEIVSGKKIGHITGADVYSPASIEPSHPDLFWYGIHGVELLYAIMGPGCEYVTRVHTAETDIVTGVWRDGRVGTFRGTRTGRDGFGGVVFGENGQTIIGEFAGYLPLLKQIIHFFQTGVSPVSPLETQEIYAFMEAADESKRRGGKAVRIR